MSRIIQQIATVQFQVDNRKVTASMNALQTEAESLNGKIAAVKQSIKGLGDVPADNKFLLEYQKQLRQLNSDLKDVKTTQRDLMKGVKAADQLWKAAAAQDIESLSIKAIKAGQNGLRKRMDNLRPELGGDEQKMYDAYKAVIDEADRVMNVFKSNYATVVQTIRDGGIVSEKVMRNTRDALRDLMEAEKEGTAEYRQLAQQYDFLNESLANVAEMRRREKGEIVNANDARREALKLTEDGIAAARRERDMADEVIAGMQQQKSNLEEQRKLHEDRIAQTEREIAANQSLEEAEQDRLADVEKAMRYTENEDRKEAIRLRKKADAARDEAEAKNDAYEQQAEQEKLLRQHVKDTGDEVTNLTAKLEALEKTEQQKADHTTNLAQAQELYNRKVEERIRLEKELEVVKNRSWRDDPEIKRLGEEIAKLDELIAVSDKYKKQFAKMSDSKFEEGYMGGDSEVRNALHIENDPQKSIWGAADYLKGAYLDRDRASLAEYVKENYPDDGTVAEYQKAAERVAKGIVQNAQENFRRAIYKEIQDGNWTSEAMEQKLDTLRRNFQNEFRNARSGELRSDPDYNYYKYAIAQMEKYIEVARQVEAEREKIAGGKEYIELAREKDDLDQPHEGLVWQRQKRAWDSAVIKTDEIDRRREEDVRVATEAVTKAKGEEADAERKLNEVKQQSTTATNDQTEAIKKQEEELGKLKQKLKYLEENRDGYQDDVKESLKAVKDMGLTEEDLADDAKVREAVEKKVLEIMEAQAKVGQEIAEQRKKLAGEVKMSDLGGTKADQEFYAKNKSLWDVSDYASPDDMIERIAHLERLKRIKNGKRFNPDEDWDDDDELDEDAPIMNDKEKQAINDELRFLKQHIREELLKTIKEVGDIDKAVEQYTGGDGVSEEAKFGEQLNDKIGEIKDKIEENIETTLDRYGEMLNEDRDIDSKMTKEQLTKRVSQHMEYVKENHGVNRSWIEDTQGDIKTTKDEIAAKEQLIDQMKQQAAATKESTTADQQSVDVSKQKKDLEDQLKEKTKEHTKVVKDYEAQQEKTNKAYEKAYQAQEESVALNDKAAAAEEKVAHQEERHAEAMDQQSERLRQIRAEGQRLLTQYEQQKSEIQAVDKAWADADVKQGEAEARKAQNQELTTKSLDDSIRKLKEANAVIDTNSDEWEENTRIIQRLQAALDEMKNKPALMMMTDRMQDVSKLSTAAVSETRKFWEAMVTGAERGSKELAEYEGHLKIITEEEQKRRIEQIRSQAFRVKAGLFTTMDENELRESINAAREYQKTLMVDGTLYNEYSEAIAKAEKHLRDNSVETERAKLSQQEMNDMMRQQLNQGTALTESALRAQQQYWQRLIDDPKTAAESLDLYKANLKEVQDLQQQQANELRDTRAARLSMPNQFANLSETELRQSIEAGKQLLSTYKSGSAEAEQLAKNILAAENHIKTYGLEAQRAAQKEAQAVADAEQKRRDADTTMRKQLYNTKDLTESALKAQENYWKRLIDDPNTAAASLDRYRKDLERVHLLQEQMEQQRSAAALEQRRMAGEIVTVDDAMKKAVTKTEDAVRAYKARQDKESWEKLRESAEQRAEQARLNVACTENEIRATQQSIDAKKQELSIIDQEIAKRKNLEEALAENKQMRMDLAGAQDEVSAKRGVVFTEKGEWLNRNDEVIKATVRIDELKENLQGTSDLKEQQKILQDLKVAEDELTQAKVKAEEQNKKLEKATEELRAAEDKTKSIQESLNKQVGGRNFEKEEEELNELKDRHYDLSDAIESEEKKHSELTERLKQEQEARSASANAVKWAQENETKAAIEMAQAQNMSQEAIEQSINILENAHKKTSELSPEYNRQADAIGKLKQRLAEMKGEWMSLAQAEELASQAGTEGFIATGQQMKQAQEALERQRDTLIKSIQAKRQEKNMTDEQKEALAAEEAQLDKVNAELKKMKFEMDNTNMSAKRMNEILDNPSAAKNIEELGQAVKRAQAQLKMMEDTVGNTNKEYKEMAQKTKEAAQRQKELEVQFKASASAFDKAWSRLKTYVGLYVGASVAMNKLMGTISDIHELSDRMGEVAKTTDLSADAVGRLTTNLKKIDSRTGIVQLLELSAAAGQLGLKSEEDIQGFTEAANKLMVALPEMGKEAATEMMRVAIATGEVNKIQKEMQEGTIEGSSATAVAMEKIASTIDRLRASSASAAPEITDFVKRVGAVGAQSGITIDQVAALGSTVSSLGMRVEMSATALSRMIPAIKNNAFELSKAIGVTPETIRNLFDTGRGMEVILMILQRIKDSGMDADSIENMLGMAGMKDIMKDLNQQGARAGIVFSGLSQNVDVLRQQLGIAKEAYEENIAIQKEYNRMNETTAAKWERLRNQVEEMFVGDKAQRWLGNIIDGLRWIVDWLAGDDGISIALRTIFIYLGLVRTQLASIAAGALRAVGGGLKNIGIWLGFIRGEMTKLQWGNIFLAAAGAVYYLVTAFEEAKEAASSVSRAMGEIEKEMQKEMATADQLFRSLAKVREEERRAASAAKEQAGAEERKTKVTDKSTENTNKLSKETEKLTKSEKGAAEQAGKVEDGMKRVNTEGNKSAAIIREINSKYGTYLGYMISETSSAQQLAAARELINAKLRETITLKQKEAAMGNIEQEYGGKVNKKASAMDKQIQSIFGNNYDAAARVSVAISEAAQKYAKDSDKFQKEVRKIFKANRGSLDGKLFSGDKAIDMLTEQLSSNTEGYREAVKEYQNEVEVVNRRFDATNNINRKESQRATAKDLNAILGDWKDLVSQYKKAEGEEKQKLAVEVYKQQRSYANAVANNADYFENDNGRKALFEKNINNMKTYEKGLREVAGEAIRTVDAMERAETVITNTDFTNGGESANNPWGKALGAESTDWKNMTAEQLVNRRKQMKDFVNAIQTDTDVQAVLKEDAALKAAIEKGMSSDMRTVIEWYNTERLKIQDELHARHLTNTGDWMDPKKERGAKKQFRDEMDAYLHELDAYYTERKTRIEEAGTDEGLTEAEIRNRTLNNEMEWQQRRAELQKLYSRKQKEVTQDELDAIYHIIAERTGDSESFVKAQIAKTNQFVNNIEKSGEKGAAIVHRWMSQVELDTERSYLKGQQALTKQMRAIEAIIDKERPFNGITKSLQESLSTMDILTGEMRKEYNELMKQGKDTADFNARQRQEEMKRTAFLLGEAENAYSTTIDRVMDDMRQKGMTAWADWLSADPKLQEALMAQLRSTYDAIQDAIKKEASQLKKQAEIMWNNILMPDGQTTLKQQIDRIVAQLSLDESRVKRANSLIGAGQASERVADKLAIQQMKVQLAMQEHYYNLMRKRGQATVENLEKEAKAAKERLDWQQYEQKMLDAKHARMSLNLATAKEETELAKQREEIVARTEESQNRLYQELRSWADLLTSSLQGMFEAAHAGDAEYYNELAKMNLTGKGGPGAGTYIVIDDEGTEDATAHYEYLTEREALEREHEIEIQNARAEAWRKLMDDVNMKMSETITDQLNAMLQNKATEENTAELKSLQTKIGDEMGKMDGSVEATNANTDAIRANTEAVLAAMNSKEGAATGIDTAIANGIGADMGIGSDGVPNALRAPAEGESGASTDTSVTAYTAPWQQPAQEQQTQGDGWLSPMMPLAPETDMEAFTAPWAAYAEMSGKTTKTVMENNKKQAASTSSMFAKMTQAANLYGVAYQAMSNDNLDTAQKFEMIALQAVGNAAIAGLGVALEEMGAKTAVNTAETASKDTAEHGSILGPILTALSTAVLGGLMGLATSKIAKSKSKIASITGANAGAGRLATGMLTYAEGNVNEFTDPASLTPGRRYNVDAADGRKYRARYMGSNPRTHITNGPEFHLSGEKGREMIIDAGTTRQITMNETEVWNAIKTLSGGGRIHHALRRGRGVRAFADGNVEDFMGSGDIATYGAMGAEQMTAFQQSLDRNNELLERALTEGIKGVFDVYGKGGLVDSYDTGKRTVTRYGESY